MIGTKCLTIQQKCFTKYGQHIIFGKCESYIVPLMPITTQMIAKGVPPWLHQPKPKGKPCTTMSSTNAKEHGIRYGVKSRNVSRSGTTQKPTNINTKSTPTQNHKSHVLIV